MSNMADHSSAPWAIKDIVYVSIVGVVMFAAIVEWVLWLTAFLYCLVKAYQKAENSSTRVLAIVMMVLFTILRIIFLPVMIVTLPLPSNITRHFPHAIVSILQWFAFWTFSGLLTIPWLMCIYQLVTHSLGRTKRIKYILDEIAAPKVVVVMPCYREIPEILLRTVDSLVDCDYPSACLHIFLSFDGDQEDELYLNTIEKLGIPLVRRSGFPTSIDVTYRQTRITVSRFPHGGKRHCQKKTFRLIDKIYNEYLEVHDNLFVLFIDSDCILDKVCIQNFMYEMELKPGSKNNMLAMTGIITATTEKNTLLTLLQDIEYIHGQLFERSVESGCGAVTCLPGALTILRFSAFRKLAKYYFADKAEQCDDLFDYGKCHLGEDRWLTHLFMIAADKRYQIGLATNSFLKTESVQTYKSLLKQRRRWFLGFITNEVCMITDIRLWMRYPILCIVRFAQNTIRTTALLFFIMVISLLSTAQTVEDLPVGFIAVSLGLNWALMIYFAVLLGRYKIMLYPILFVVGPFFNWLYMVYGIFTAGQRTWGGPRADAGQANSHTTPQAAIEHAEATGDDLNVVPETFRPSLATRRLGRSLTLPRVTLQPSDHLTGRFRPNARDSDDWLQSQGGEYNLHHMELPVMRSQTVHHVPLQPRLSLDSNISMSSAGNSVSFPRRAESFLDLEDGRYTRSRYRAHPPSAQSAFFEARRESSRPSSGTWSVMDEHQLSRSLQSSSKGLGIPEIQRDKEKSLGGLDHSNDIALVDLSRKTAEKAFLSRTNDIYAHSPRDVQLSQYQNPFETPNASQVLLAPISHPKTYCSDSRLLSQKPDSSSSNEPVAIVSEIGLEGKSFKEPASASHSAELSDAKNKKSDKIRKDCIGVVDFASQSVEMQSPLTPARGRETTPSDVASRQPPSTYQGNVDIGRGSSPSVAGSEPSSQSISKRKKLQKKRRVSS